MRILFLLPLLLSGVLFGKAGQNIPHADITPNRKPQKVDIYPPPAKNSPRALPRQEGLYISADFLMWQMRMDGLDYIFTGFDDSTLDPLSGGVWYPSNRWRPGFKVGLGTFLPRDSWRLSANYTYYQNNEASNITNPNIYPTWYIANNFADYDVTKGLVTSAGSEFQFMYNTIDFALSRTAFLSDFLIYQPFVGFKGAWITQKYTVNYAHQFSQLFAEELTMQNNQDYYGFGLRFGSDFQWSFDQMLSLVGNGAYSLMWSRYNTTRRDTSMLIPAALSEELVNNDTKYSYFTVISCFEYEIGAKFEWWLYKDVYHFEILGMWEIQYWLNQNQLIRIDTEKPLGDLSLTGFTLRMRLDF